VKKYPKSDSVQSNHNSDSPAYVSWDSSSEEDKSIAFTTYAKAIEEASHSVAATTNRDFRGLTSYADGRPGLRSNDFDWFRPGQAAPVKPKDIIAFARYAYRRIGLIHNAIDLMGDFAGQGVRLVHPNKRIERFYNDWFEQVQGKKVTERLGHLLFREANVPIRWYTAKVNKKKRLEMQKSIAAVDISVNMDDPIFTRNEIPWRYTFIDPILVEPIGGALANLSKKKVLALNVPLSLKNDIKKLQHSNDPAAKEALSKISPDIVRAVDSNNKIILPPDKTSIFYYKKDDWQVWADPMTYSAFEPLNLYQRLQLTDKAALDGAMNKIRVWKIGSLEHKLAPTPTASSTLADMLGANVGGGTIDIVWGPDIELLETSSDIQSYLGEEKYRPTLMAIYASLGIPPTLTGTFGTSGTTNNFIALKTLVERLNYVRNIINEFWKEQIRIVQKSMGFRQPAMVEFDIMYLEDPASMINLLTSLADRNILSDEFVQRHIKATPDIETRRIQSENKNKESKDMEKVSPYHQVDKDHALKKIALQTGVTSPSEVGLELEDRKKGEKSMLDMRQTKPPTENNKNPSEPGRPKTSKDTTKRKQKEFQPKVKAYVELWAKGAQSDISDIINPVILKSYSKSSLRNLSSEEFNELEKIKFEILCNLNIGDEINSTTVAQAANRPRLKTIHSEFDIWLKEAESQLGKLTIEQVRDMRISYCINYKSGNN
jgi:hypothetical protein